MAAKGRKRQTRIKLNPWLELENSMNRVNAASARKTLRHEQHDSEVFGMFAHYGWAVFSLAQGLLSVAYAWAWYGIGRLFDSPAAQAIFWLAVSGSVFGLGGAIWHLAAGRQHQKASWARR
jgi:hypothetical protein